MGAENSPQTAFYDEIIRMAANENIQVKFELKKEIKKVEFALFTLLVEWQVSKV